MTDHPNIDLDADEGVIDPNDDFAAKIEQQDADDGVND